ncbi:MAG: peptidylprolyl isomerase [Bacteroidales bacterium]|nr:peptidylprolyl isomerase [Bacteroidales bacterium]
MRKAKRAAIVFAMATMAGLTAHAQPAASSGTLVDGVAAVVGKNIVKYSDIDRTYAQMRLRSGAGNAEATRCAILENLVLSQLLIHKGEVDSVEVSDAEVNQYLQRFLDNDMQQYGSREALREATGFSYDELKEQYERMIRNSLLSRSVEYQITEGVKVTPAEVTEFFNNLPADSLPMMSERYELSEIVIEPVVSEEERDRVRTELGTLRERVVNGESFSMLAALYSQDPGTARKGGETGFFARGKMVQEFESAAFALKPGEVSPIIETQFGFHIIQLIERRGNTVNVRHILISPKVSPEDLLQARMKLDSLATEIRSGNLSFEDAAKRYSTAANAKQGGFVTNSVDGSSRFDADAVKQSYYSVGIPGMDVGQISNATAFKTEDNHDAYRIVRLNRKYPSHRANLVDDYDNIYNAALADAKQKRMLEWARRQAARTYIRLADEFKNCTFENLGPLGR